VRHRQQQPPHQRLKRRAAHSWNKRHPEDGAEEGAEVAAVEAVAVEEETIPGTAPLDPQPESPYSKATLTG